MPNAHNRTYHAQTDTAKASQGRLSLSGNTKVAAMLCVGSSSSGAPPPPLSSAMTGFYLTPQTKALAAAARFYIYGKGCVSKETFDDP